MARFRRPDKAEVRARRRALAERAAAEGLPLPGAVRDMRQALGLSQAEFADLLRMTRRQIAEIERGEANPTQETLARIGRLFGFRLAFVPRAADDGANGDGNRDRDPTGTVG
jgi:ribosome-binding protein aMBF1 (putative translation factor)